MKIKRAVLKEPGWVEIQEKESSVVLKDNEVLLRIHRVGICGSDMHMYLGEHPFANTYPMVQGHEYGGEVVAIGAAVSKLKPGMKATAIPYLPCGKCSSCRRGQFNICQHLSVEGCAGPEGAAQEYFIIPEERAVVIPDTMTYEEVALVEPVAVGVHATKRTGDLWGKNVVVMGAGTIGNLVAQFAAFRGANKVLVTDLFDFKLEVVRQCSSAIETANLTYEQLDEAVQRVFGEERFQVGFEVTGAQVALTALVEQIENSGTVIIIGVYAKNPVINMGFVGEHELNVLGSVMYLWEDYLEAVKVIAEGKIITGPLITQHFGLDDYQEAYQFIKDNREKTIKVMIDVIHE